MRSDRAGPPSAGKSGFALPAVLTVTTALTLVFLTAMLALEGLRDETRSTLALDAFHRAALSAEAHITFVALTEPFGPRSINIGGVLYDPVTGAPLATRAPTMGSENPSELRIDGSPYAFSPDISPRPLVVSIQDEAGLVNLNYAGSQAVSSAFQRAGADPLLAETLADQMHDYTSTNGARSLRGADAAEYERAGVAPPPNRPLEKWSQLYGLLALKGQHSVNMEKLRSFATVGPFTAINVNTASTEALQTWFGISEGMAKDIAEGRERQPISSLSSLAISVPAVEQQQYYFPDGNLRMTFTDPSISALYRAEFQLDPNNPKRPFWILDAELLHQPQGQRLRQDVSQLPKFPDVVG